MSKSWDTMKRIVWRLEELNKKSFIKGDITKAIHQEAGMSHTTVKKYVKFLMKYEFLWCNRWHQWFIGKKPKNP